MECSDVGHALLRTGVRAEDGAGSEGREGEEEERVVGTQDLYIDGYINVGRMKRCCYLVVHLTLNSIQPPANIR